jgi:hypothetical protein
MVNILRRASTSRVVDEQVMQTFRHQWQEQAVILAHVRAADFPEAAFSVGAIGPRRWIPRCA